MKGDLEQVSWEMTRSESIQLSQYLIPRNRLVKERNRREFKGEHHGVRRHASLERSHNHNRSIKADYESENMQTDLEQRKQNQGKRETLICKRIEHS
ncbi:hypothetical protein BRARA_H01831 [Brassica rapa]|uniref:Uncharacterized protein n=1 Tax=Brassica campestris TaxID=3711 RepID=A0A397YGZ4_BRACM|nr:hypothetical protein BRARA_H01831 [Brassica rapa]